VANVRHSGVRLTRVRNQKEFCAKKTDVREEMACRLNILPTTVNIHNSYAPIPFAISRETVRLSFCIRLPSATLIKLSTEP
jgi:hypothetical protein